MTAIPTIYTTVTITAVSTTNTTISTSSTTNTTTFMTGVWLHLGAILAYSCDVLATLINCINAICIHFTASIHANCANSFFRFQQSTKHVSYMKTHYMPFYAHLQVVFGVFTIITVSWLPKAQIESVARKESYFMPSGLTFLHFIIKYVISSC